MTVLESRANFHTILRQPGFRQFVKFCVVGATSTFVDFAVYLALMEVAHLPQYVHSLILARTLAQLVSFTFAVTNGFIWNSRWTFRHASKGRGAERYGKFVLTNLI